MLDGITPISNDEPIFFSLGEPQKATPMILAETIAENGHLWNRYPPPNGDVEFRRATRDWLYRRYRLPDNLIDPDKHIMPVPGTREPLYQIGFLCVPAEKNGERPAVLMPNPFYHVYQGAAMLGRADAIYLPAKAENNFFPNLDEISPDTLARTAVFFLCSPANPQGTTADKIYLKKAVELAREYDFVLALDECYCEIYRGKAPLGGLEVCGELGGGLKNVVSFNSLSKRSSAPGLRSGFIVGDPEIIERYGQFVTFGGAPLPLPILKASTALWKDDSHVAENRSYYEKNFHIAKDILGKHMELVIPPAGFFLWLDVGDGRIAAMKLWREAAIKTVPGELMGRDDKTGVNPGKAYLRVALVYDSEKTEFGLKRLVNTLFG
tara:strand:- start:2174 stop:3313 length:1140 start_codon:yes stop_codon:yes gene_type:complete